MNFSVLERMIQDGDISSDALRYLINCKCECEWLDYKELLHIENDIELCGFTRDILAFKNVGGGYIIVGVQDKTWKPLGIATHLPYDSKMLRDKIRKACGLDIDVDVVNHELHIQNSTKLFSIIYIRSSKKRKRRRIPALASKDFCPKESFGIRRGDIYIRKGDSTEKVKSEAELHDLLDRIEAQADQDALAGNSSPFAVSDGLYMLLEKGFEHFIGRKQLCTALIEAIVKDPRIWILNNHQLKAGGFCYSGLKVQLKTGRLRSRFLFNIKSIIGITFKMMRKVILDHLFGEFASGNAKVSPCPEMSSPISFFNHRKLFKNLYRRLSLDTAHYF